jgi:hypothetical protein
MQWRHRESIERPSRLVVPQPTKLQRASNSFLCLIQHHALKTCGASKVQIQKSGFDSRHYKIFWEVVGLERGPLSLVSTTVELLERKSSGSGLENREYGCRDPSRWPLGSLYPQKLALTSTTNCCRSVGIVRSRTQATEFSFFGGDE